MAGLTDEQYRETLLGLYDHLNRYERRELFRKAIEQIDRVAGRHWEVVDAYEDLLMSPTKAQEVERILPHGESDGAFLNRLVDEDSA